METMKKKGSVCLVGAGPGDPELITAKGMLRLKECDAVVYDSLSSDRLLELAGEAAERIYVGKRAGRHSMKQEEINAILVRLGNEGKTVVRLKGGDPFVFGRGGEEILALQEAGIPYETVPGVTSAVAVPASVGIPVTHRAMSRSFHVMTGHTLAEGETLPPDFPAFASLSGTLVFLMGMGNLHPIVEGLLAAGKPETTPAAVIENGTLPEERSVRGCLGDIEERVREMGIGTPAIIVVGETAALDMSSTVRRPLDGISVSVTGTASFSGRLIRSLTELGASAENICRLGVESFAAGQEMSRAYKNLGSYTWVAFTSANAVRLFFEGLLQAGGDFRSTGHLKMAAVGKGTARELRRYGFTADYVPERYQVEDLAEGLAGLAGEKDCILIPRSSGGSRAFNEILEARGIPYDDIVLYDVKTEWREREALADRLRRSRYLTFASGSGVEAFFDGLSGEQEKALENVRIVCIGAVTARALEKRGRKADVVAETFSIQGMTEAMVRDAADGSAAGVFVAK